MDPYQGFINYANITRKMWIDFLQTYSSFYIGPRKLMWKCIIHTGHDEYGIITSNTATHSSEKTVITNIIVLQVQNVIEQALQWHKLYKTAINH